MSSDLNLPDLEGLPDPDESFWKKHKKRIIIGSSSVGVVALAAAVTIPLVVGESQDPEPEVIDPEPISLSEGTRAYNWAQDFEIDGYEASEERAFESVDHANTVMHSTSLSGEDGVVESQVHSAGTAYRAFESYVEALGLSDDEVNTDDGTATFDEGFLIVRGDVVILGELEASSSDLLEVMQETLPEELEEAQCANTAVLDGHERNEHFYPDEYTGLYETENIETEVEIGRYPQASFQTLDEIEDDVPEPDGPISSSLASMPSTDVDEPDLPEPLEEDDEVFEDVAEYQIVDSEGPGCGWEWTQSPEPEESVDELEALQAEEISSTQDAVDEAANDHVDERVDEARSQMMTTVSADNWNAYVDQVNAAHDDWEWLENEREEIRDEWEDYVEAYDYWDTFEERQQEADEEYREELNECTQANQDQAEWDNEYDSEDSQGGGGTGIPERPSGCDEEPEKPDILDEDRPRQPIGPDLPDNVTIPDSWPQPGEDN